MARLFIGPREHAFIADIVKELVKDVSGQKIYYYSISPSLTNEHSVYAEAPQKVFSPPVEIEALVSVPEYGTSSDQFSIENTYKVEVYLQWRDVVDKGIEVNVGDFFTYGDVAYEIGAVNFIKPVYGQIEHKDGVRLTGNRAREGQLNVRKYGPTDYSHSDPGAVQEEFVQQRGERENRLGPTNDVRELIKNEIIDPALTGPKEVSRRGGGPGGKSASFYDE